LSVTIPTNKRTPFFFKLSKAALIGAVNTIKITKGKLKGYNTVTTVSKALEPLLQPHHKRP
jgi:shikimate 5-dehydrogenase